MVKANLSTPEQHAAALARPASDPPTRDDGRCYVCGGERSSIAVKHDDPFCSGDCARDHHGTALAGAVAA